VFGSVARGEDTTSSDVDLLVELDEGVSLVDLAGLKRELSELLGVDVDVVPAAPHSRRVSVTRSSPRPSRCEPKRR
jgi:predicted nucleotidyltransferase